MLPQVGDREAAVGVQRSVQSVSTLQRPASSAKFHALLRCVVLCYSSFEGVPAQLTVYGCQCQSHGLPAATTVTAGMRCSVRSKGVILLSVLLVHTALGNPVVKRDVRLLSGDESVLSAVADPKVSLVNADVFGGEVHENGARDKRTILKLKALGLGAAAKVVGTGVKAVGAGVKTVAVAGAKKIGGAALKVATTVGVKVAKAAITIGIAKLLLHLVFGTKLLGNVGNGKGLLASSNLGSLSSSSGSSSSSSGGSGGAGDAGASIDSDTTEGAAGDSEIGEDLPQIDPQKVSLQIPSEIVSGGFNVVNRAAPVVGEVIQRTAERLVGIGASLKPLFGSSLGFGGNNNYKREAGEDGNNDDKFLEQENEASNDELVTADAPSQFKRSPLTSDAPEEEEGEDVTEEDDEDAATTLEEDKKKLENLILAKRVIEKLLEKKVEEESTTVSVQQIKRDASPSVEPQLNVVSTPSNPYFHQQYRNYNPHVKRQAPSYQYFQQLPVSNQQYRELNPQVKRQAHSYDFQQLPPLQQYPAWYQQQYVNQYTQNSRQFYVY